MSITFGNIKPVENFGNSTKWELWVRSKIDQLDNADIKALQGEAGTAFLISFAREDKEKGNI